jgi:hypothetical protein
MSRLGDAFRAGKASARRPVAPTPTAGNPYGTGGRSGRLNAWPRCRAPRCWSRVPPGAVHQHCRRAWSYGSDPLPDTHPGPCCPGACPHCLRCFDTGGPVPPGVTVCPGRCETCGRCQDLCAGHDEDDN